MSEKRDSIFEVLDDLIFHLNTTKNMFSVMIISAFILAPLSFILTFILVLNPRFLRFLLTREPDIGIMLLIYIIVSVILSAIWLFIGIKEQGFFSKWDKRFKKFISLKKQIDEELDEL
ncbi:MAG: hypothetical protein KatS3mg003_0611 [Candidatus Nitrosocaldaceae archaeon]|nr:MAG: hypothetical protein KatS3mg003_0611 [Candidatus Nitrosocaldaceae archaeon]